MTRTEREQLRAKYNRLNKTGQKTGYSKDLWKRMGEILKQIHGIHDA